MVTLAFILSALLAAGGVGLWVLDARQRTAAKPTPAPAAEPASLGDAHLGDAPRDDAVVPESQDSGLEEPETAPEPVSEVTSADIAEAEHASDPGPEPAPAEEREPQPLPEPAPAPAPEPDPEQDAPAAEHTPTADASHEQSASPVTPSTQPARSALASALPGAHRRERRAWAEAKGFEFTKSDHFLADEWSRGAASTGASPRDIARGSAYGHEVLLFDLGGVNIMAMRRGELSDVVVDLRREGFMATQPSEDLIESGHTDGFNVFATEPGAIHRAMDIRFTVALEQLPAEVEAVWMESDWVLAQTSKGTHGQQWDAMIAPMALLADVARVLPPRTSPTIDEEAVDPTRPLGKQDPQVTHIADADSAGPDAHSAALEASARADRTGTVHPGTSHLTPITDASSAHGEGAAERGAKGASPRKEVARPEEPVALPSRTLATSRGVVEPREVGGDEVEAIASDRKPVDDYQGTRVVRRQRGPSSIFDDGPAKNSENAENAKNAKNADERKGHDER